MIAILFCDLLTAYYVFALFSVLRGEPKKIGHFGTVKNWVHDKMDQAHMAHHAAQALK